MFNLKVGDKFDTRAEKGCIVQGLPDQDGNFDGLDSDGVECSFHVRMVLTDQGRRESLGTPLSELSGRPGHPGYDKFCQIAASWGYD